jgi:hypothetical protein
VSYTPDWIFDISIVRTASEFLSLTQPMDSLAKKYSTGLSEIYSEVYFEQILEPAEEILRFLSEVKAQHMAVELLKDFSYFRMYYVNPKRRRKLKPLFGTLEGAEKKKNYSPEQTVKSFKAFVFALRSKTVPEAPIGWTLDNEEALKAFRLLVNTKVGVTGHVID